MEKSISQLKVEIYSSSLPPDFEVVQRIQATYMRLEEACKNGTKDVRDNIAREIANLTSIKKSIEPKVWRNL